jgi:hypothetical protein
LEWCWIQEIAREAIYKYYKSSQNDYPPPIESLSRYVKLVKLGISGTNRTSRNLLSRDNLGKTLENN